MDFFSTKTVTFYEDPKDMCEVTNKIPLAVAEIHVPMS